MRYLSSLLIASLLALPLAATAADEQARVIVRFKPQADSVRAKALSLRATAAEARDIAQVRATGLSLRQGRKLSAGRSLDERTHVVFAQGLSSEALVRRLAADPEVELAVVDGIRKRAVFLPNDPLFGGATVNPESIVNGVASRTIDQWYLKAPSNTPGQVVSSINAPAAWDISAGASVRVAVLDTGVRTDHPDLANQFVGGYDMIGKSVTDGSALFTAKDGDGADPDPSDPGDAVLQSDVGRNGCDAGDVGNSSWHGTRVSGLIAAIANNGQGMAGVAFGSKVLPVRVLGRCGGYDSDIVVGMRWAAGLDVPGLPANPNKAKVINMSLGGGGSCDTTGTGRLYRDAITEINAAGSIIVVAAGNSAGRAVGLPGNCPGVITVGALRHVGTKVGFSSIGPEVTIAAPGGNCINVGAGQACLYPMVSTTNAGTVDPVRNDASYTDARASVGTSFSAPIVSGVVALMAAVRPSLSSEEATNLLRSTARAFPSTGGGSSDDPSPPICRAPEGVDQLECYCTTQTCGAGMLDAFEAVKAAQALSLASVSISASPASGLRAGDTLTLNGSITGLPTGRAVRSYAWSLVQTGGIVSSFDSGASSATATIKPSGAGSFTVRLTVTDIQGLSYTQTLAVNVAAAPPPPGTGGGASSGAWLALLLLAGLALPAGRQSRRG